MSAFHIWKDDPPRRETVVMAKWSLTGHGGNWQIVKTCARGCCVFDYPVSVMGAMILPKFWREPTSEELEAAHNIRPTQQGTKTP